MGHQTCKVTSLVHLECLKAAGSYFFLTGLNDGALSLRKQVWISKLQSSNKCRTHVKNPHIVLYAHTTSQDLPLWLCLHLILGKDFSNSLSCKMNV